MDKRGFIQQKILRCGNGMGVCSIIFFKKSKLLCIKKAFNLIVPVLLPNSPYPNREICYQKGPVDR